MSIKRAPEARRRKKLRVFTRDSGRCHYCHSVLTLETMTLDHVVSKARGGGDGDNNLVLACPRCNNKRGTRLVKCDCPFCWDAIAGHEDGSLYNEALMGGMLYKGREPFTLAPTEEARNGGTISFRCPCGYWYEGSGEPNYDHPVEFAGSCHNCGGVKCMGCVFRVYDHQCRDSCPDCCADEAVTTQGGESRGAPLLTPLAPHDPTSHLTEGAQ